MASDDVKTRLLESAGPIFAEKGFAGATIREICHAAGANLASVNYHFGDKRRLYIETVKHAHPLSKVPNEPLGWPPHTPASHKLAHLIAVALRQMYGMNREPWQARLLMREMTAPSDAARELIEQFIRRRFNQLCDVLGEILPAEVPPHRLKQTAFSVIGQVVYLRAAAPVIRQIVGEDDWGDHFRLDDLIEHVVSFSFAAVGIPAAERDAALAFAKETPAPGGTPRPSDNAHEASYGIQPPGANGNGRQRDPRSPLAESSQDA